MRRSSSTTGRFGAALLIALPLNTAVFASTLEDTNRSTAMAEFARDAVQDADGASLDPDPALVELGHMLFFDPRMSRSGSQSCATCHNPALAWGDGLPVGVGDGMNNLGRRSPTILNTAFAPLLFWDGRAESLEEHALGPIVSEAEMNMALEDLLHIMEGIVGYRPYFAAAFGGDESITTDRIAQAIAAFERTVISGEAPFDRWIAGEEDAISEAAQRGFDLFTNEAKCSQCHDTWRFTDDSFHDIGLDTEDLGRGELLPSIESMQHACKTPTLRNIDQRAPYMHAGQIATLRDVVIHYNDGGIARPSRSPDVGNLGLTDQDIDDLVAFMRALTSEDEPVTIPVLPH